MGYARHEEIFYQGKTSGFSSVTREKLAAESAARHLDMAVHKKGQKMNLTIEYLPIANIFAHARSDGRNFFV